VYWQGDYAGSVDVYEEALDMYRRIGDDHGVMRAGNDLAYALLAQRSWAEALPLIEERLEAARAAGNQAFVAELLGLLGIARAQQGDYEGELEAFRESLTLFEGAAAGDPMTVWVGEAKGRIGAALRLLGRLDEAEAAMLDGLRSGRQLAGNLGGMAVARQLGAVEWDRGNYERALILFGFSDVTSERIGGPPPAELIHVQEPAHYREQASAHLEEAKIEEFWSKGRAMSLQEGIAFMLGESP
jgi:non-specific serine/threonine protein kinase